MKTLFYFVGCALAGVMIAVSCNSTTNDTMTDTGATDSEFMIVASKVSECGGFDSEKRNVRSTDTETETLIWEFDSKTGILDLIHAGLVLNCCGIHTIEASIENDILTLFEDDQPDSTGGRCRCICPFDFAITLSGMKSGDVTLRIMLRVDDDTTEHWTGQINLGDENGIIPIATTLE